MFNLGSVFHKNRAEKQMDDELRFHLEKQIEQNIAQGMSPKEARYAALRQFGNVSSMQEECRDRWNVRFIEELARDLRYGLRQLRRNPGFTTVAILTLALGIGANTAIFSIVNGVLLKPLPYPQPSHLMTVWGRFTGIGLPEDRNWISAPEFRDLKEFSHCFTGLAAMDNATFNIAGGGRPERIQGAFVSPSFFSILGVDPVRGRAFTPEEGEPGNNQELLLSYGLWQRRFGGDPGIVGRTLDVNGYSAAIVGVLPKGFSYPFDAAMWQPLAFSPSQLAPDNRGNHGLQVLARIRADLTLAQARDDMQRVTRAIVERNPDYPYARFNFKVLLVPLLTQTVGDVRTALWVLCGAVGFVLLIACVNMASLLLGRASAREHEMAVRISLGASPRRIIRQLLAESVLLSSIGGLAALLIAPFALHEIIMVAGVSLPRMANVKVDGSVLLFTMAISLLAGVLFGLAPAFHSVRRVPYEELKGGGRGGSERGSSGRLRRVLVICEIALSLALLAGAGLLLRSFVKVLGVDTGFHAGKVLTMRVALPEKRYSTSEQRQTFYHEILDRIERLPGVEAAGATAALPISGQGGSGTTTIDTQEVPPDKTTPEADLRPVTPGYFKAIGMTLIRGRFFTDADSAHSAPVAIIDDSLARTFFHDENPIGKRLRLGGRGSKAPWMTIVGVVAHVRYRSLETPSRVQVYWPEAQMPSGAMSLAIRTSVSPLSLVPAVEREVLSVDPNQPVYDIRTMEQLRSQWLAQRFLSLLLVGLFAAIALGLAAVGIYGVMAHSVTRRTHEIGIRMALGAEKRDILKMLVGQGFRLSLVGVIIGIAGALGLTRFLSSLLFGITPTDPATFIAVSLILITVALLACYIPARRAAKVDPMVALRYE